MLRCPASTLSFFNSYICIAEQNLKLNQFCKKLAEVIVIQNRASSIDKHTKKTTKCLSVPAVARVVPKNSSNNASSLAINPSLTFFSFNLGALDSGIVRLKTGLDRASTIGKLGDWTSRASEIRSSEDCLMVRFPLHPLASQL